MAVVNEETAVFNVAITGLIVEAERPVGLNDRVGLATACVVVCEPVLAGLVGVGVIPVLRTAVKASLITTA